MLKGIWSDRLEPPAWAKLAYDKHWITLAEYLQVPMVRAPSLMDLIYEASPLFGLLRKKVA